MIGSLWQRWLSLAHRIAEFQVKLILTLFYIIILLPFAIWVRLIKDPLEIHKFGMPVWSTRRSKPSTLDEFRKQ